MSKVLDSGPLSHGMGYARTPTMSKQITISNQDALRFVEDYRKWALEQHNIKLSTAGAISTILLRFREHMKAGRIAP